MFYQEIFSSVAKINFIRILLLLVGNSNKLTPICLKILKWRFGGEGFHKSTSYVTHQDSIKTNISKKKKKVLKFQIQEQKE